MSPRGKSSCVRRSSLATRRWHTDRCVAWGKQEVPAVVILADGDGFRPSAVRRAVDSDVDAGLLEEGVVHADDSIGDLVVPRVVPAARSRVSAGYTSLDRQCRVDGAGRDAANGLPPRFKSCLPD
jgi:hypothetical protein